MSESDNRGCRSTIVMALLTIIAIAMLLAVGTVAAPLDKLQPLHTEVTR